MQYITPRLAAGQQDTSKIYFVYIDYALLELNRPHDLPQEVIEVNHAPPQGVSAAGKAKRPQEVIA